MKDEHLTFTNWALGFMLAVFLLTVMGLTSEWEEPESNKRASAAMEAYLQQQEQIKFEKAARALCDSVNPNSEVVQEPDGIVCISARGERIKP